MHCPLQWAHTGYLYTYNTSNPITCYNIILFIIVTVYGTSEQSLVMYAFIYGACIFHISPRMPFQCQYHSHHNTSPFRASRLCVDFSLDLNYKAMRYTPACSSTPSVTICHFMPSRFSLLPNPIPSFIPLLCHQLPPGFENLLSFCLLLSSFSFRHFPLPSPRPLHFLRRRLRSFRPRHCFLLFLPTGARLCSLRCVSFA